MSFDGVPWTIGGGAENDEVIGRILANAATRDSQGILLPGDLKVHELGTPGDSLIIDNGADVIRNVQSPGESYIGRAGSETTIYPAHNDSGSTRHDLIMARIRDPAFSPWTAYTDPEDIAHGPYHEPFIYSGCGAAVTQASEVVSYSAVALARLDIPARTSTFTDDMLADLRVLAQPRIGFAYDVQVENSSTLAITDTTWKDFPTNSLQVAVPRWATHCQASIQAGYSLDAAPSDAQTRVKLGTLTTGQIGILDHNATGPMGAEFLQLTTYGEFDVRALQGQTVTVKQQAQRTFTVNTGVIACGAPIQVVFDLRFSERVV